MIDSPSLIVAGTQTCGVTAGSMPVNEAGSTPMTVNGRVLMRTSRPMTSGSAPSCARQKPSPSTTTAWVPSVTPSSGPKVRPRAARTPMTSKKSCDTISANTVRGAPSPCRRLATAMACRATPEKTSLPARRST